MTTMPELQGAAANASAPNPAAGGPPDNAMPVTLVCRAVDLSAIDPSANSGIAYAVESELKACPLFDQKTQLASQTSQVEANGTFTFGVKLVLQNPLKL
jgi:hypothetical protein